MRRCVGRRNASHRRLRSTESTDADTGLSSGGFPHYTSHLLLQKLCCTIAGSGSTACLLRQGSHRRDNHLFIQHPQRFDCLSGIFRFLWAKTGNLLPFDPFSLTTAPPLHFYLFISQSFFLFYRPGRVTLPYHKHCVSQSAASSH